MIEEFKSSYNNYIISRNKFIDSLMLRASKIGTVKVSQAMNKDSSYITNILKRKNSDYKTCIKIHEEIEKIEKELER